MLYFNNSFDGATRSCVKWQKAKGGAARCAEFEAGKKYPTCPGQGLKGGGRSQNYIRGGTKKCKATASRKSRR